MRLSNYLLENIDEEEIITILKRDCGSFLDLIKEVGPIYRGANENKPFVYKEMHSTDRLPRDIPLPIHKRLNELFMKKFRWPVRNGIFCTKLAGKTYQYVKPYCIVGIGNKWKYCWSTEIMDLYGALLETSKNRTLDNIMPNNKFSLLYYIGRNVDILPEDDELLKKIVDTYKDKDLRSCKSQVEISFWFPDGYYLVPSALYNELGKLWM